MKKVAFCMLILSIQYSLHAQNTGIGTNNPQKKLSVNGTVVVDHDNRNEGSLDSAALLFGINPSAPGITSSKNISHNDYMGLNFWTGQQKRFTILENGNIGINTSSPAYKLQLNGNLYVDNAGYFNNSIRVAQRMGIGGNWDNAFRLKVADGDAYFEDKVSIGGHSGGAEQLYVQSPGAGTNAARFTGGNVSINEHLEVQKNIEAGNNITANGALLGDHAFVGGALDFTYKMRVYGNARIDDNFRVNGKSSIGGAVDDTYNFRVYGNSRIDDNFRVENKVAIGGAVDDNFKLRVYGGNSRFGGNVEVTGSVNTASLTIGGKGSVKSNGSSPLKIHFTEVWVESEFNASGQLIPYIIPLPDFDNVEDVRLSISHFETNVPAGFNPQNLLTFFTEIDPVKNQAILVLRSLTSNPFIIGGTYYIMVVMKDNS